MACTKHARVFFFASHLIDVVLQRQRYRRRSGKPPYNLKREPVTRPTFKRRAAEGDSQAVPASVVEYMYL